MPQYLKPAPFSLQRALFTQLSWSAADPHCNVTCPCSAFNPDTYILSWLLTHLKVELVIGIEGEASSPLAAFPEDSVSFRSNTPVTGVISSPLCQYHFSSAGICIPLTYLVYSPRNISCIDTFKLGPQWSQLTAWSGWNSFMPHFRHSLADLWSLSRLWASIAARLFIIPGFASSLMLLGWKSISQSNKQTKRKRFC